MSWYIFAFAWPVLWSISNHIDKYILSKYLKNWWAGALTIFAWIIWLLLTILIFIFARDKIISFSILNAVIMALNGALLIIAYIPYYYAISKDEASIVVPIYQTIPIFSYILWFLVLWEKLTLSQILAWLLIIIWAVILSLDLENERIKVKGKMLFLMILSSFLIALHFLVFKFVVIQENFWWTSFYEYIWVIMIWIILFTFVKNYRNQLLRILKENTITVISITWLNEIVNLSAKLLVNFATILAPIALVTLVNGFQPFFVFIFGLILTLFLPKLANEKIAKKHIVHRILGILIIFIWTYFLF